MKFYFAKTPKFVTWLFPKRIWAFSQSRNSVFLTFDDGPIPEVTPWVLEQLKRYNAKATFFCIGANIEKYPDIFQKLLAEGHSFGNHTFHHLNGSKTSARKYIENVEAFEEHTSSTKKSNLFRPPYGKLTQKQASNLQKKGYKIVMWDIISYDWDKSISEEKCLQNISKNIKAGSIIVLHDSLKAEKKLRYVLPKVLELIKQKGWKAEAISM